MNRLLVFFFNDTATTEIYTLSLHDALPIFGKVEYVQFGDPQAVTTEGNDLERPAGGFIGEAAMAVFGDEREPDVDEDRKSTRLNSSHANISYAGFCLKKKKSRPDNSLSRCQ